MYIEVIMLKRVLIFSLILLISYLSWFYLIPFISMLLGRLIVKLKLKKYKPLKKTFGFDYLVKKDKLYLIKIYPERGLIINKDNKWLSLNKNKKKEIVNPKIILKNNFSSISKYYGVKKSDIKLIACFISSASIHIKDKDVLVCHEENITAQF